ncbi:PaaI family thioesterase [soil metagenome]
MIPADPHFRDRMQERFHTPVIRFFGIAIDRVEPGHVTLTLDSRPELGHRPGWFPGSITTAIAEFAAAWSEGSLLPADWSNLTLDQTIKFVGAAEGDRLIARGSVIKPGRTITTCMAEVFARRAGEEHLCAVMLQTNRHAPGR